jgi:hypothetical protein
MTEVIELFPALRQLQRWLAGTAPCFQLWIDRDVPTMLDALLRNFNTPDRRVHLLAPTARAARQWQKHVSGEVRAIHDFLYSSHEQIIFHEARRAHESGPRAFFSLGSRVWNGQVYVVVGASLIGDEESADDIAHFGSRHLLSDLVRSAGLTALGWNRRTGIRILFVDDPANLRPGIGASEEYLRTKFGIACEEYTMCDAQRAEQTAVPRARVRMREGEASGMFRSARMRSVSVEEGVERAAHAAQHGESAMIITSSEERAWEFTRAVRQRRWGDAGCELRAGDLLRVRSMLPGNQVSYADIVAAAAVDGPIARVRAAVRGGAPIDLLFREVTLRQRDADAGVREVECVILENLLNGPREHLTALEMRALHAHFEQLNHPLRRIEFHRIFEMAMEHAYRFDALPVRYGYASTCRAAQDCEWDTVIADFRDDVGRGEQAVRWAHTAMSRARRELLMIGRPGWEE